MWATGRFPFGLMAVVATAHEDRVDGDVDRAAWRDDQRYTQCDRGEAGVYLRFLESLGYERSPVERAAADGVPCRSEQPEDDLTEDDGAGAPMSGELSAGPGTAGGGVPGAESAAACRTGAVGLLRVGGTLSPGSAATGPLSGVAS